MKLGVTGLVLVMFLVQADQVSADKAFFLMTASVPSSSTGGSIIEMDPVTNATKIIDFDSDLYNPIAVDYDPQEGSIYWSEVGLHRRIRRASRSGGAIYTVMDGASYSVIDGLAVDPYNRLVFYSDTGRNVIGKLDIPGYTPQIIIDSDLDQPRAIVLHTQARVMFWTDWGQNPKIERATYSGADRRTLVYTNLYFINALALDVPNNRLYWTDAATDMVEVSDLEGNGRRSILSAHHQYHFFGMALHNGALYITDWGSEGSSTTTSNLVRVRLDGRGEGYIIKTLTYGRLNDIHAYGGQTSRAHSMAKVGGTGVTLLAVLIAVILG